MVNETERDYSIKDAAAAMGISETTTKAYKATLIKAFNHCQEKVLTDTRSLNEYGLEQLKEVQKFHKIGAPDAYVAQVQKQFPIAPLPLVNGLVNGLVSEVETPTTVDSEVVSQDFIRPSKLAVVNETQIQIPSGFDPAAMVRLFDGVVGQASDTTALLAIADTVIDSVKYAMHEKIHAQRLALRKGEIDDKALTEKVATAKADLKIAALESKLLAERQTSAATNSEATFADLMNMGKPTDAGQS